MQMSRTMLAGVMLYTFVVAPLHAIPATPPIHVSPALYRVTGDKCSPLPNPKRLPAVDVLFDSSALATRLSTMDTVTGAETIVSVRPGEAPTAHVMDIAVVTPRHQALVSGVIGALRANVKDVPASFRLHIRNASGLQLTLDRSELCPPVSVGGASAGRTASATGKVTVRTSGGPPVVQQPRDVQARFEVDTSGLVSGVNLGGGTGFAEIDRQMRELMENTRYTPATLDGKPVAVIVTGNKIELRR